MILLYHLIFPDSAPQDQWNAGLVLRMRDFRRHIQWLKKHYIIVSLEEYLSDRKRDGLLSHKKIAITFDDGYRNTFDLISPFLSKEQIPVTFFATTSHLKDGELLWFVYINALCSERCYEKVIIEGQDYHLTTFETSMKAWRKLIALARESGNAIAFSRTFYQKYPLPEKIISKYAGLTKNQISSTGKSHYLEVGGHTSSHPYLDQIPKETQLTEMLENKRVLEEITQKQVRYFAYTGGVYNTDSIDAVKVAGFEAAFAITPRHLGVDEPFEMARVDIYSPDLLKLKLKVWGVVEMARWVGLRRGSIYA